MSPDPVDAAVAEVAARPDVRLFLSGVRRDLADHVQALVHGATVDTAMAVRLIDDAWKSTKSVLAKEFLSGDSED